MEGDSGQTNTENQLLLRILEDVALLPILGKGRYSDAARTTQNLGGKWCNWSFFQGLQQGKKAVTVQHPLCESLGDFTSIHSQCFEILEPLNGKAVGSTDISKMWTINSPPNFVECCRIKGSIHLDLPLMLIQLVLGKFLMASLHSFYVCITGISLTYKYWKQLFHECNTIIYVQKNPGWLLICKL